ncbi:MAG: hypothetical protein PF495_05215 [Spirochaetales bacterium]|jgi:hypothetical protein|nr:hypothetical protein [Spirochaetales bacterium]
MKISEILELLEDKKREHGDIEVLCINNNGPGGLAEHEIMDEQDIGFHEDRYRYPFKHLMIGER